MRRAGAAACGWWNAGEGGGEGGEPHAAVTTASDEVVSHRHHARDSIQGGLRLRADGPCYACAVPASNCMRGHWVLFAPLVQAACAGLSHLKLLLTSENIAILPPTNATTASVALPMMHVTAPHEG